MRRKGGGEVGGGTPKECRTTPIYNISSINTE